MSGEKSNPVINQLKREINCLKTELFRFKLLSNCYQKYFDYFNEINETIESNEKISDLKNTIKGLKEGQNHCFVNLQKLKKTQSNDSDLKSQPFVTNKEVSTQTNGLESHRNVFTQTSVIKDLNETKANVLIKKEFPFFKEEFTEFKCLKEEKDILQQSFDGKEWQRNFETKEVSIQTNEVTSIESNDISNQLSEEEVRNESQIRVESLRNFNLRSFRFYRKRKHNSISGESEDNDIECIDNSDNDCNNVSTDRQMSRNRNRTHSGYECPHNQSLENRCQTGETSAAIHSGPEYNSNGVYICQEMSCGKHFESMNCLKFHEQMHSAFNTSPATPQNAFPCDVEGCAYFGSKLKCLKRHKNRIHFEGQYKCQWKDCTAVFEVYEFLVTHMRRRHRKCRCNRGGCGYSPVESVRAQLGHNKLNDRPINKTKDINNNSVLRA